jgi:hypothetical protein
MNIQHAIKRILVKPIHTAHLAISGYMIFYLNFDYVTKMTYNKDKDLVFVYKPDGYWNEKEYVHEVAHLEHLVPSAVSSWKDMSAMRSDGIVTITDMAKKEQLKFYQDKKYWNGELRAEFFEETGHLWKGQSQNKYRGLNFYVPNDKLSA